jgi:hypothetical protein
VTVACALSDLSHPKAHYRLQKRRTLSPVPSK